MEAGAPAWYVGRLLGAGAYLILAPFQSSLQWFPSPGLPVPSSQEGVHVRDDVLNLRKLATPRHEATRR